MKLETIRKNPSLYKVHTNIIHLRMFQERDIPMHDIIFDNNMNYREYIPLVDLLKIKNIGWKIINIAIGVNYVKYL